MSDKLDLHYILDEVVTLPSLPATVIHTTELINDPNCQLSEVGKAIAADTSLALKTLRLVNSAYYGLHDKVDSVEHAVTLLGMKVIKNLVLTAAVFDTLQSGEEILMRHNVACGLAMRILAESGAAKKLSIEKPEETFIYGLLHDVGKIILKQFMPDEFKKIAETAANENIAWNEAEQKVIGSDHAEIGAALAKKWKLSDELISAIAGQHDLSKCTSPEFKGITALLSIADYICYASGMPGHEDGIAALDPAVWEITGVTSKDLVPIMDKFTSSADEIDELAKLAA